MKRVYLESFIFRRLPWYYLNIGLTKSSFNQSAYFNPYLEAPLL